MKKKHKKEDPITAGGIYAMVVSVAFATCAIMTMLFFILFEKVTVYTPTHSVYSRVLTSDEILQIYNHGHSSIDVWECRW